jgi:DNA-binding MarR family transcriptional regulator
MLAFGKYLRGGVSIAVSTDEATDQVTARVAGRRADGHHLADAAVGDPYAAVAMQLGALFGRTHQWQQKMPPPRAGGPVLERPAYFVLAKIHVLGPVRPSALAELLGLDLSTVSRHIAALERAGWIARERDPEDGRAHLVQATAAGTEVFHANRQRWFDMVRQILSHWPEADLREFVRLLTQFNDAAEAYTGGGAASRTTSKEG